MATIWFLFVLFCLLMYVVLDGYDLGIGDRHADRARPGSPARDARTRRPGWDGNETWLVLLGVSLWAGFPAWPSARSCRTPTCR